MSAAHRAALQLVWLLIAALIVSSCGGDDADTNTTADRAADTPAVSQSEQANAEPAAEDAASTTPACERLTAADVSSALPFDFGDGSQVADGQCLFEAEGGAQLRLQLYAGASTICTTMGSEFEQVDIAGHPGFWDEAGGQARACLPAESIAVTLYGGGGDNATHRSAILELVALAAER